MIDIRKIARLTVRQARADKAYTALYIGGVALSIATVLIFAVIYYVRIAPIYPEVNRDRTLYLDLVRCVKPDSTSSAMANLSYRGLDEWIYRLENVEAVSAKKGGTMAVSVNGDNRSMDAEASYTDVDFFNIYEFDFIEGSCFSEADFNSGIKRAVIAESLARKLFGTAEGVTGREFMGDGEVYTVAGVVKSPSRLTRSSFAEVYAPYTATEGYDSQVWNVGAPYIGGGYSVVFLVSDARQEKALRHEMAEFVRKNNASGDNWSIDIFNQPRTHLLSVFQRFPGNDFSWLDILIDNILVLLALLLVPAINISAMIAGRMDSRLSEIGIRKAFGADRRGLLSQIMWENLLLTLTGGMIGLVAAWVVLYGCRTWVFDLLLSANEPVHDTTTITVTGEMLFAPAVFLAALLLCVALNVLSAFIPAWRSLRHPIVDSLNEKR